MSRPWGRRNRRRGARSTTAPAGRGRRLRLLAGLVLGASLVAVGPYVFGRVRRHAYFAVREVAVRGHAHLPPAEIRRTAGLEPGMSIWDVDELEAEARLRRHPWVAAVRVRREPPDRVVLRVREERPFAILALAEPKPDPARRAGLYYVSARGRIVAPLGGADPRDFPVLTGLAPRDLDGADAFGPRALRRALDLVRLTARDGALGPISEIHIDRARGLTLLPVRPAVPIELGWGHLPAKLARLSSVLALWAGRESGLGAVSLVFDDEVIVRPRTRAAGSGRRTGRA